MLKKQEQKETKSRKLYYLTKIALLGAIAGIAMMFEFPLPFMPTFLKMDASEIPVLLGTFALGPIAGILISLLKNLIHLPYTHTMCVGEFANFLVGISFVIPAGMIYKWQKTKKSALISLGVGTISMAIIAGFLNYFLLLPFYQFVLNWPLDTIIELGQKANPSIVDLKTMIILGVVPFNIIKGIITSIITFLIYKKTSVILNK